MNPHKKYSEDEEEQKHFNSNTGHNNDTNLIDIITEHPKFDAKGKLDDDGFWI